MNIKIGDRIHHGGEVFMIVNIKHEETVEGMGLMIQAVDPETAQNEQQKKIKVEQVNQGIVDTLKKLLEGKGPGQFGIGFPMGGE